MRVVGPTSPHKERVEVWGTPMVVEVERVHRVDRDDKGSFGGF